MRGCKRCGVILPEPVDGVATCKHCGLENRPWPVAAMLALGGAMIFVVVIFALFLRRGPAGEPTHIGEAPPKPSAPEVEFDGRKWLPIKKGFPNPNFLAHELTGTIYRNASGDDDTLFFYDGTRPTGAKSILRRLRGVFRQTEHGGFKSHGLEETWWDPPNDRMISHYVNDVQEGDFCVYQNERLVLKEFFVNGKRHGLAQRWWPSGAKQYEIIYSFDVELEAKLWNEDGTPRK